MVIDAWIVQIHKANQHETLEITIPAKARKALGLRHGQKALIKFDGRRLIIEPLKLEDET